jgi:hypothetical protein
MEFGIVFIAILIAIVAVFIFYKMKAEKPGAEPVDESVGSDPVEDLLSLNLDVRKSSMPANLVEMTEELIDLIVDLLPLVREQASASGELTWTVNRISSEYLPNKCVYPFIKLDKNCKMTRPLSPLIKTTLMRSKMNSSPSRRWSLIVISNSSTLRRNF